MASGVEEDVVDVEHLGVITINDSAFEAEVSVGEIVFELRGGPLRKVNGGEGSAKERAGVVLKDAVPYAGQDIEPRRPVDIEPVWGARGKRTARCADSGPRKKIAGAF